MKKTINEVQDQIIEDFLVFDDWMDRYNYLIELSEELPALDNKYRNDQYLIEGCQSRVWINGERGDDGNIYFSADSDAIIVKGLVTLLVQVYSGRRAEEIYNTEPYFIERIGMKENLSPTRANGLVSMIKRMKMFALAFMESSKGNL